VEGTTFLISILSLTIRRLIAFLVVKLSSASWIRSEPATSKEVSMGYMSHETAVELYLSPKKE
jgi:hypothetical protein